jgi:hypothetical protein
MTDREAFELRSTLVDLVPTILAALDARASIKHTGACCTRSWGGGCGRREGLGAGAARRSDPRDADERVELRITDTEADEMEEHLRGLGYLE